MSKALIISDQMLYKDVITGGIETRILFYINNIISETEIHTMLMGEPGLMISKTPERNYSKIDFNYYNNYDSIYIFGKPWNIISKTKEAIGLIKRLTKESFNISVVQRVSPKLLNDIPKIYNTQCILANRTSVSKPYVLSYGGFVPSIFRNEYRKRFNRIVHIGRMHRSKGQLELVKSYREKCFNKHGFPLYLYGGTHTPEYLDKIMKYVDNKAIFHKNWINPTDANNILNDSKFFVMNSPEETFSIGCIEALAAGCTVIVNGNYIGQPNEFGGYVYGNRYKHTNNIHDFINQAIELNLHIDGSDWAINKYNEQYVSNKLRRFIRDRRNKQ